MKLVGDEVEPVMPDELTKIIRETPRDTEVIDLLKILSGAGPLPPQMRERIDKSNRSHIQCTPSHGDSPDPNRPRP